MEETGFGDTGSIPDLSCVICGGQSDNWNNRSVFLLYDIQPTLRILSIIRQWRCYLQS